MPKIQGIDTKKIRTDIQTLEEQSSSPSTPDAGDKKFYAKDDGKIYTLDDTGSEVELGAGGGSGNYNVDKFTLDAGDITAKGVTLTGTPTNLTTTRLVVIGGIEQDYTVDFSVTGTALTWNGLGLESLLVSTDKIVVIYN